MPAIDRKRVLGYRVAAQRLDRPGVPPADLAVVLVDGEVAGTWRARQAGKGRLEVTVAPFHPLPGAVTRALEAEAATVGAARGAGDVRLTVEAG